VILPLQYSCAQEPSLPEKRGELLYKINTHTNGQFEELLGSFGICPLCAMETGQLSILQKRKGEKICVKCGYVGNEFTRLEIVPFGFAGAPGSLLSDGKGLGGTLQDKGTFCVLARSDLYRHSARDKDHGSMEHAPMSAKFIRIMESKREAPKIRTLLRYGRKRCVEWGFYEHDRKFVAFRNFYGKLLRTIGAWLYLVNMRTNLSKIANGCFVLAVKQLKGEEQAFKVLQELKVNPEIVNDLACIFEVQIA
jgi:hypothetical protein